MTDHNVFDSKSNDAITGKESFREFLRLMFGWSEDYIDANMDRLEEWAFVGSETHFSTENDSNTTVENNGRNE